MATISSHILDSVRGNHAQGIRVDCFRKENADAGAVAPIFSVFADVSGRISETVEFDPESDQQFELVFYVAEYFAAFADNVETLQIMPEIVVRVALPEPDTRYHLPLVLSPHSYTLWWSGVPSI